MKKYVHRVNRQEFINLPGYHDGAYVRAYIEDTSGRDIKRDAPESYEANPEPRIILNIADCSRHITIEYGLDSANNRQNSFHKIDTLIDALQEFRQGLVEESTLYKQRQRKIDAYVAVKKENKAAENASREDTQAKQRMVEVNGVKMTPEEFFDSLDAS